MTSAGIKKLREIVAEMRGIAKLDAACRDMIPRSHMALGMRTYADRLDAALAREAELADDEQWAPHYEVPTSPAPTAPVGNAAALREALESTEMLLEHFAKPGTMLGGAFALHMRDNRAALSAPARNCDSCDDVDAAVAACMQAIDAAWHEIDTIRDTIGWMLAPAEGDGHA